MATALPSWHILPMLLPSTLLAVAHCAAEDYMGAAPMGGPAAIFSDREVN